MKSIVKKILTIVLLGVLMWHSIFLPNNTKNVVSLKEYYWSTSRLNEYSQTFIDASLEFGVPASILMAMAIEETSFGTAGVAVSLNNWFGMEKSSLYPTDPNYTGRFEKYPDAKASIRDAARLTGSPKSVYKVTNIIINRGSLDKSYDAIAQSITSHWCVDEPGFPCSYDAQTLLDDIDKYDLKQYDFELANLSIDELKAILNKYYGPNAIVIPGYENVETGWDGNYQDPDLSNNTYNYIYLNTSYSGDITKGYIYQKYSEEEMWDHWETDSDNEIVDIIKGNIFVQGEQLYGDGELHISDFLFNGTDESAPGGWSDINGIPMACKTGVTSEFGTRIHPITKKKHDHSGIDLSAPRGTAIYSITDGVVTQTVSGCVSEPLVGCSKSGYGNHVRIKGTDGNIYIYAHMYTTPLVSQGDSVTSGQQIGTVGTSGSSTGNHLHFEVRVNGVATNPRNGFLDVDAIPKC